MLYKIGFISKTDFNINLELNDIDFNNELDITILLRIAKNIFNNYYIYIYKEWIFDLNKINTMQNNNVKDSTFSLEVFNYDCLVKKGDEISCIK